MKVENLIIIIDKLRSLDLSIRDELNDWSMWQKSKPTTIHKIAEDKICKFELMESEVHKISELIKQIDL